MAKSKRRAHGGDLDWLFQRLTKISSEGALHLPKLVREKAGFTPGTELELIVFGADGMWLRVAAQPPVPGSFLQRLNKNGVIQLQKRLLCQAGLNLGQTVYMEALKRGEAILVEFHLEPEFFDQP